MAQFRSEEPNVVIFGDSNTWVFGPAFRDWITEHESLAADQVVIKYKSGSTPAQWLADSSKQLWTMAEPFEHGPSVAESLSPATVLVVIGLGGNMAANNKALASVAALLDQVEDAAPKARIVWRGVPPATQTKSGKLSTKDAKLGRYIVNHALERELLARGFRVFDGDTFDDGNWGAKDRRVYLDLISLHACGPSKAGQAKIGTQADREWEQAILDAAPKPHLVEGARAHSGPWTSFVRARDDMKTPTHVPREAARNLVQIVGDAGVLALGSSTVAATTARASKGARHRVIDAKAYIRSGPPKFKWNGQLIPLGTVVTIEARDGDNVQVHGIDGTDYQWTRAANLELIPEAEIEAGADTPREPETAPLVVVPDVYTVVDNRALLREGPPGFAALSPAQLIPRGKGVYVDRTDGNYALVRDDNGPIGWTASSNLRLMFKDTGALQTAALRPARLVQVTGSGTEKAIATTYNRLGGLMDALAAKLQIDTEAVLAVWMAESSGKQQEPGKMTIRFENHVLFNRWGDAHVDVYDRYFCHGGHNGVTGKAYQGHGCCKNGVSAYAPFHGKQEQEYAVLDLARQLAGNELACRSISMGGPQIMGFHHDKLGYPSAVAMFDAFQTSERVQVLGFFDFVAVYNKHLLGHVRNHEWRKFGRIYNGKEAYGDKIESFYTAAQQALSRRV